MKNFLTAAVLVFALMFGNQASAAPQTLTFDGRYDFAEMTRVRAAANGVSEITTKISTPSLTENAA